MSRFEPLQPYRDFAACPICNPTRGEQKLLLLERVGWSEQIVGSRSRPVVLRGIRWQPTLRVGRAETEL